MRKRGRLITIGSFDGVHRGHAALLDLARQEAQKRNLKSMALTFKVPPRMVLNENAPLTLLSSPREKDQLIRRTGIDEVDFFQFDRKTSFMRPFGFFRDVLLNRFKAKGLVVGSDFRFGSKRSAGAGELVHWGEDFGVPVWVVSPVRWKRKIVSSTTIRELLQANKVNTALDYIGHPYLIEGRVVRGAGIGSKLGFPTVNLQVASGKLLPKGVFVVRGWTAKPLKGDKTQKLTSFEGVCNIGSRPTIHDRSAIVVEVHIFKHIPVNKNRIVFIELLSRLRGEKKFRSVEELQSAIRKDVRRAKTVLAESRA